MAQIKGSIVVLLLLGMVALGVYAGDGKLPWPPPTVLPTDEPDAPPLPRIVDRPAAVPRPSPPGPMAPPAKLPRIVDRPDVPPLPGAPPAPQQNGPRFAALPSSSMPGTQPPSAGRAGPYPLMTLPATETIAPPQQTLPSLVSIAATPPAQAVDVTVTSGAPAVPTQTQPLPPFPRAEMKEPLPAIAKVSGELPTAGSAAPPDVPPPPNFPVPAVSGSAPAPVLPTPPALGPAPPPSLPPPVSNPAPSLPVPPASNPSTAANAIPAAPVAPAFPLPVPNAAVMQPQPALPNPQLMQPPQPAQVQRTPALLPDAGKVPAVPLEPPSAPAPRFTPAPAYEARSFPSEVPQPPMMSDQPKAFRILVNSPQDDDPPPPRREPFTPSGPVVATSTPGNPPTAPIYRNPQQSPSYQNQQQSPSYQNQQPLPSYQNSQQIASSEPNYGTSPPANMQSNSTPITAEMIPPNPNTIKPGNLTTYELVLRNPAQVDARDVRLEIEIQGGKLERALPLPRSQNGKWIWTFASFPARGLTRITLMVRDGGNCVVSYSVDGPPVADQTLVRPQAASTPAAAGGASLAMTMTGPASADVNQPVTFYVRVVNTGSQPLVNPMIHLALPAGLTNQGGSDRAAFKTLMPGGETMMPIRISGAAPGRHTLHCWVEMAHVRLGTASASISIGRPGVQIFQHPTTRLEPGRSNDVRFEVVNNTTQDMQHVLVRSNVPDGLRLVYASDYGNSHDENREVTWFLDLKPGEARVLTLQVEPEQRGEWSHVVRAMYGASSEAASTALLKTEGQGAQVFRN